MRPYSDVFAPSFLTPQDQPLAIGKAADNLGLLLGQSNPREATALCRKAYGLRPDKTRYAYALALLLHQDRQDREALAVLGPVVAAQPGLREAALLYAKLVSTTR